MKSLTNKGRSVYFSPRLASLAALAFFFSLAIGAQETRSLFIRLAMLGWPSAWVERCFRLLYIAIVGVAKP